MIAPPPEKLGSFFLGAKYDSASREITSEPIHYDSRDLVTHAICVGMTGSGKTGLCIGLLEEAAIDGVPALIVDPKGDMTNLLLQFEGLGKEDFKKWVNADDAARKGMDLDSYAQKKSELWQNGIKDWGQDLERVSLLKNSVDYTIFTPGSDAGISINILGSFSAPTTPFDDDAEMQIERIQGIVGALLGMIESKEDPARSKEGILLANLFEHYWRKGEDLDLVTLIKGIQKPPFKELGVFEIDTFFPEKERFKLAMEFNGLVASPQFKYWLQGEDLDIDKLYFTADGKPRHSIFYIAHLSDSERMFFVTLLLNSLIGWMRRQSGTTSLRSLLYFDEIFGYFPPTAQPPSKKPLLTLLKQARAYGVGCVLVTQNPVDIDYKGLANAGTWFIGKMQTERDKMRVLDGLQGAIAEAGGNTELNFDKIISSLASRVFLMHNVHQDEPVIYHTRWVLSYLAGPLTRPQVKGLMASKKNAPSLQRQSIFKEPDAIPRKEEKMIINDAPPSLGPDVEQRFFAVWKSASEAGVELGQTENLSLEYKPKTLAIGKVRFYDSKRGIDVVNSMNLLADAADEFGRVGWDTAQKVSNWEKAIFEEPDHGPNISTEYDSVPEGMNSSKKISKVLKDYSDWLYQSQKYVTQEHSTLKLYQESGESIEAFRMRVQTEARNKRDEEIDELQEKYEPKFDRIAEKIRKEEQDLENAKDEVRDRRNAEMIGMAETIFSVFVKRRSRSFSSAASKSRMKRKAKQKLEDTREDLEELNLDYTELENQLQEKLGEIRDKWEAIGSSLEEKEIKPRRADVKVDKIMLVWQPFWKNERGDTTSAVL